MHWWAYNGTCAICGSREIGVNAERVCLSCHDTMEEESEGLLFDTMEGERYVYELADWRPDYLSIQEIERGLIALKGDHYAHLSIRECQEIDPDHPYGRPEHDIS